MATTKAPGKKGSSRSSTVKVSATGRAIKSWLSHPMANIVLVFVPTLVLLVLGVLMVWSASTVYGHVQFGSSVYFLKRQLAWLAVGVVAALIIVWFPLERLRQLSPLFFVIAALAMSATFIPGVRHCIKGNCNWIKIGPESMMLRFQPAELAKLAIIVFAAAVWVNKDKLLTQPKHLLVPVLPFSLLMIFVVVVVQHDMGTGVLLTMILMLMLWTVGASWRVLGSILGVGALGAAVLVAFNLNRMERFWAFLNPEADPTGANHQANQAQYGLASGGWFGVGIGESRQKWGYLAESHTDYVLAVTGEEMGWLGVMLVIVMFLSLGFGGLRIAVNSSTFYGQLVAGGITGWITLQALINMLVVFRWLPVIGVPLPFMSYGGSALLVTLMAVGMLINIARHEPEAKRWWRQHRPVKQPRRRLTAVVPGARKS